MPDQQYEIGEKYTVPRGCPKCGSDLEVTAGVAVMCVNWQHPHLDHMFKRDGDRSCDYALMSG